MQSSKSSLNFMYYQKISKFFLKSIDHLDYRLCSSCILKSASWEDLLNTHEKNLYAGRLSRSLPQFSSSFGLTPFSPSTKNICHDISKKMPLPNESISTYQSEDVFEHIPYNKLPEIIEEIYRVLIPGGLFRLSVPDYRCEIYQSRSLCDSNGNIAFDPGGGGRFVNGKVIDGGHLWFPRIESVRALLNATSFNQQGKIEYLQYYNENDQPIINPVSYNKGFILRSAENDNRNNGNPISIIIDAYKS